MQIYLLHHGDIYNTFSFDLGQSTSHQSLFDVPAHL